MWDISNRIWMKQQPQHGKPHTKQQYQSHSLRVRELKHGVLLSVVELQLNPSAFKPGDSVYLQPRRFKITSSLHPLE